MKQKFQNTVAYLLYGLCYLFAILPSCIRFGVFRPLISFLLHRVFRYRRYVIRKQLSDSFPNKSEREIDELCGRCYDHLAEMIICTLSLPAMTDKRRRECNTFSVPENFSEIIEGRSVLGLGSHFGFWEYYMNVYIVAPNHHLVGAYRPLSSPIADKLFRLFRRINDVEVTPSKNFMRQFLAGINGDAEGKFMFGGLIADQNCPAKKGCCWHKFLNHDTVFFDGAEQLAVKFGIPIFYLELERIKAGHYRQNCVLIYDGKEEVRPHEITERYVRCLERTVEAHPEHWMWSHRRWKYRPTEDAQYYDNYKERE